MEVLRDDANRNFGDIRIGEFCLADIGEKRVPMLKVSNNFELALEYSSINTMWHVHRICPTAKVLALPNPYLVYGKDDFSSLNMRFGKLDVGDAFYLLGSDTICIKVCTDRMKEIIPGCLLNTIEFDTTRNLRGEVLIGYSNRLLKYDDNEPVRFLPEAKMIFRY